MPNPAIALRSRKLAGEQYLCTTPPFTASNAALRYSNVYGPRQDPHGEAGVVAIFGKRILSGTSR